MLKSSLLEILRTFSKQELIKFEDFARSPYFNKKENVIKLFLEIKKFAPGYSDTALKKENIWKVAFPGKDYNYGIMKNLIFELNRVAVKFIEIENYSDKKFDSEINILEQYLSRRLLNSFEKKTDEIKNCLSKEKISSELYYKKLMLGKIELKYLNFKTEIKEILKFDYSLNSRNLNQFFFTNHFYINADMMLNQWYYNKMSHDKFSGSINALYLEYDQKNYYSEIFYYSFKCCSDPAGEENYYRLKEIYFENFDKLEREDQGFVTDILIAFCIWKSNHGSAAFVKDRFIYHKIKDDNDFLSFGNNDKIADGYTVINTVIAACTAGEFEWGEQFIEKCRSKLESNIREKIINLAYTHLNFKKNNFEKALEYLSQCGNPKGMDKINLKTYQIFLYYELRYFDELKNLIDTCRHFLRTDKSIAEEVKLMFGKFLDAVNKLNEYKYKKDLKSADEASFPEIKNYITDTDIPNKGWLIKKLAELEG